jgi:hypothetical protein
VSTVGFVASVEVAMALTYFVRIELPVLERKLSLPFKELR